MLFSVGSVFNMSELVSFITGVAVGIVSAFLTKGKAKQLPQTVVKTSNLLRPLINDKSGYKMVFVVRNDLGMSKGKVASQCAHATLMCYNTAVENYPEIVKWWSRSGQAKIALKVDGNGEQEILKLFEKAEKLGVVTALVRDAGRTQIQSGTITVLGLGPSSAKLIDQVSGHLKLL